jgi:hypothetical protein
MGNIFEVAGAVSTAIGLVAFGFACYTVIRYQKYKSYENTLKGTDDKKKVEVIKALRDRLDLDLEKLTKDQTFQLALHELKNKKVNDIWRSVLVLASLTFSATIAYTTLYQESVDLTFRAVAQDGNPAFSDRGATVTVHLPNGTRTEFFTKSGQAVIKGVSREFLGTTQKVIADIYYYDQGSPSAMKLSSNVMDIQMTPNYGTADGLQYKRVANLHLLKLLIPYRLISSTISSDRLETDLSQYCLDEFKRKAVEIDLSLPISELNLPDLTSIFDVLAENEKTIVPKNTETIERLIEQQAIMFKGAVQLFTPIDPRAVDPKIRQTLQKLAQAQFVEISASGASLAFPEHKLYVAFLNSLCSSTKEIHDNNALNPFAVFYSM